MWLRLLMQLGELLPHLSRLLPMMERAVLTNRTDPGQSEFAEELRTGVSDLRASHQSALRQLHEQSIQLAVIEEELKQAADAAARSEQRSILLEKRVAALHLWLRVVSGIAIVMLSVALLLLAKLALHP